MRSQFLVLLVGLCALISAAPELSAQPCAPNCWTLTGRVLGPQAEPIAGVDLDLNLAGTTNTILLSGDSTAADGSFTITLQTTVVADFYDVAIQPIPGSEYFPTTLLDLFLVGPTNLGDITLDRGSLLTGQVIDEAGLGIAEIDLNFFIPGTATELIFSGDITDLDGSFSVLVTPAIYDIEFRTTLTTVGGPYVPVFLEARPLTTDLDLGDVIFFDGHVLTGSVHDALGVAVSGADIDVRDPITGIPLVTPSDNTDVAGNFTVLVPTGSWNVEIDPPLGTPLVAKFVDVVITGGITNDIGIVTLPNGVNITGTTTALGGAPVAEVDLDFVLSSTQIEVPTAHDNANAFGVFSVQVEPDTYDVQFRPPFATGLAPLVLPAVDILVDVDLGAVLLEAGPALTGTVTSSGVPVEGCEVTLHDSTSGVKVYTFGNDTNALGDYALRQIAGTYDVTITPPIGSPHSPATTLDVTLDVDTVLDHDFFSSIPPAPVASLVCPTSANTATLTWVNGAVDYDSIEIDRDGVTIAMLGGLQTTFVDSGLAPATYVYSVVPVRTGLPGTPVSCSATILPTPPDQFIRGDANDSGQVNIADVITILDILFAAAPLGTTCPDAIDANDSGDNNIADAIFVLGYLFAGAAPPPPPFPTVGIDPTADSLPACP